MTVGTALFHTEFFNSVSFVSKLSDFVYCFSQTGNLSGSGVFMIYALGSSLVDNCGCVQQCSLCSFLVLCFDCNTNLLNSGLNRRFDCFVSFSLGLVYLNSLLCRFNICHDDTSNELTQKCVLYRITLKPDTDVLMQTYICILLDEKNSVNRYFLDFWKKWEYSCYSEL